MLPLKIRLKLNRDAQNSYALNNYLTTRGHRYRGPSALAT